jgi:hypothetical protein
MDKSERQDGTGWGKDRGWVGRVDNPLDLEQTAFERLTKGPKLGNYSAFHTRGRRFTWLLLAAVALAMGGAAAIVFLFP